MTSRLPPPRSKHSAGAGSSTTLRADRAEDQPRLLVPADDLDVDAGLGLGCGRRPRRRCRRRRMARASPWPAISVGAGGLGEEAEAAHGGDGLVGGGRRDAPVDGSRRRRGAASPSPARAGRCGRRGARRRRAGGTSSIPRSMAATRIAPTLRPADGGQSRRHVGTVARVTDPRAPPAAGSAAMGTDVEVLARRRRRRRDGRRSACSRPTRSKRARRAGAASGRRASCAARTTPPARPVDRVAEHVRPGRTARSTRGATPAVATTRRCSPRSRPPATTATSTRSRAPAARRATRTPPCPGCGDVELDRWCRAVRLPAGVALDLGGIGKGAAADEVSAALLDAGVPASRGVLVNLGGDLRARGEAPEPHGWVVEVDDPLETGRTGLLALAEGAIATSTKLRRAWTRGDRTLHHLIDPRTGEPAESGWRRSRWWRGRRGEPRCWRRPRSSPGPTTVAALIEAPGPPAARHRRRRGAGARRARPASVRDLPSGKHIRTDEGMSMAQTDRRDDERWYLPKFDTVEEERLHRKQRLGRRLPPVRQVRVRRGRRRPHHRPRPRAPRPLLGEPVRHDTSATSASPT